MDNNELYEKLKKEIQASEKRMKEHVTESLAIYHEEMVQPEFDKMHNEHAQHKNEIGGLKNSVDGLKADLSTTVSLETFTALKKKVSKHLPD